MPHEQTIMTVLQNYNRLHNQKMTEILSLNSQNAKKKKKKNTKGKSTNSAHTENMGRDSEIKCIDSCSVTEPSLAIRCNTCIFWFHTVGINDVDVVGAWNCAGCRQLPEKVSEMKSQLDTLLETANIMMITFKTFFERLGKKFENLDHRITAVVNQNKGLTSPAHRPCPDIR